MRTTIRKRIFPKVTKCSCLLLLWLVSLEAEPRIWTSISGSTIEAEFLGAFGEDYWFESTADASFLKMPGKYIAEEDVAAIEDGRVTPRLPASICDLDPRSILLWEGIYSRTATEIPGEATTLKAAMEALIQPLQPEPEASDDGAAAEPYEIDFAKRRYRKLALPETIEEGSIYEVLLAILQPHELDFKIREGAVIVENADHK